jgi:uncharacterized protein YjbJ (UPF0337 family)
MAGVWDQIAGRWKQMKGEARKQWADLTDDDLEYINGEREKLIGRIQERYGTARQDAEQEVNTWLQRHEFDR